MKKTIFITAYNREKIFFNTLKKLKKCKNYDQFKKLIIYQEVKNSIVKKIKKIDPEIEILKTKYPKKMTGLHKCNLNTYKGFKKSFEDYGSDYVIYLEDDVLPSYDFLEYHNSIISRYRYDKKFFSANSFSKDSKKNSNFSYSKFIFGVGKGWSISREKWSVLDKMYKELFFTKKNVFYDCYFEVDITRKYFVVMPHRSRCLEQASNGLNSTIDQKNSDHWVNWKKSFLSSNTYKIKDYTFKPNMKYSWRSNCLQYSILNILKTKLRFLMIKEKIKEIIKNIIGYKNFFLIKKFIQKF